MGDLVANYPRKEQISYKENFKRNTMVIAQPNGYR